MMVVKYDGNVIGRVLTNHSMSRKEICDAAGVDLAVTKEDFENMPENGKYDLNDLEIVEEKEETSPVPESVVVIEDGIVVLAMSNVPGMQVQVVDMDSDYLDSEARAAIIDKFSSSKTMRECGVKVRTPGYC